MLVLADCRWAWRTNVVWKKCPGSVDLDMLSRRQWFSRVLCFQVGEKHT